MADGAISDNAAVQAQLDRLSNLSPGRDVLGLERITALLDALGNPQDKLPPVFHVAGTNGKGSTCAFLRAAIEAAGYTAHVFTSPHLVRFNERIRVAGQLIDDDRLAQALSRVLDNASNINPSFFEVTATAALLVFTENPADAVILEVGLGGRLDATNVVEKPAVCGIASLGIDHEAFLLSEEDGVPSAPMDRIAFEKTGIAKKDVPLVTQRYTPSMTETIATQASKVAAPIHARGETWDAIAYENALHYRDIRGKMSLPLPRMAGAHQADNAALAIAMLRHQHKIHIPESAFAAMMEWTDWPARLQRLVDGPVTQKLGSKNPIWLDGGHNADAGAVLGVHFDELDAPVHLVLGMLSNKDPAAMIAPLLPRLKSIHHVPVPNHDYHSPEAFMASTAKAGLEVQADEDVAVALAAITPAHGDHILIAGSLYLAGAVLKANRQLPV
ncbi:folylpolyglutamate synthase/dihydrofolate synthase family protein [Sphingorhabdus sp. Alg239-R122]|uniref:bifunctional folylpolyglutamate synthase/dihydrofolate synthase n=1 Tax=Sphingorhabdus sp. Alg239-R122 TaxID=2305989 RepID=UPI0013DA4A75|nr:folylpolyglutamate synthase/dihydrofolate synthase family protein [Sphingorhabdus sp. Alg239-R122]